ncbi:hypothetical protein [Phytopseudomonas dryadis]|uniref:Uncharacterized protein n=1 Tax=Phytopseudomonas dryadis TaxID=2487520 RepID=A0A4Q9QVU1_9GAMM|nr:MULTISPECIES: hypothetical protein [Pseudomonas]TBU87166.1 hypothetical protein DNK44_21050 [Pseudomonas dryadis]TBV01810.1 hypothetical protein DNK34_20370 [Pseudomonas dryadis]TBV14430.1 hypothetical protein DNK41_20310 [Pseudomonas sp. FRB 230]
MSDSHTLGDLLFARDALAALVEQLRAEALGEDALAIASVGRLQIRIDAADALLARAGRSSAAAVEARLAAAEAARLASELQVELLGQSLPRPSPAARETPLQHQRRQLGDHYLNGTAPA